MKILKYIFSMPSMAIQLLLFAVAIGLATFVEDIYGTVTAKAIIYNAWWFELIILLLMISLILNMFRYNMFQWKKIPVLLFHLSFVVIIIGAAFTRYSGIDGNLHVRENESTNYITSTDIYFKSIFHEEENYSVHEEMVRLTPLSPRNLKTRVQYNNRKYKFYTTDYFANATPVFTTSETGQAVVDLLVSYPGGRKNLVLLPDEINKVINLKIGLGTDPISGLRVKIENDSLYCYSDKIVEKLSMTGSDTISYLAESWFNITKGQLYQYNEYKFVIRDYYNSVSVDYNEGSTTTMDSEDIVSLVIESEGESKSLFFQYDMNSYGYGRIIDFNNQKIEINFSPARFNLPVNIFLDDFIVNRYPGSNSPSSFDSYVSVLDKDFNKITEYHIYMNHILNYNGWRFYQNSYDDDEKGSIISVTYDKWGIIVTYIGYFLLTLSMLLSLFWRGTQFRSLLGKLGGSKTKVILITIGFIGLSGNTFAQDSDSSIDFENEIFSEINKVWLLDNGGRFKPLNTLFYEIARKIHGKGTINGVAAEKAIPELIFFPERWYENKIIKVNNDKLSQILGIEGKYASLSDFFISTDKGYEYKLYSVIGEAYKISPPDRSKLHNEIIAVDERLNVLLMAQSGSMFSIFPNPEKPELPWLSPVSDISYLNGNDSLFISSAFKILKESIRSNDKTAFLIIDGINKYQKKFAEHIIPANSKNKLEIYYERSSIFSRLSLIYLLISIFVIIVIFISVFKAERFVSILMLGTHYLLWLLFIVQFVGLGLRWYITGHAPLSNGYEAMLYVSMAGLLTGLIISYKNRLLLFVTAIFAAAPLFVAHLSLMNPELTNLVPVLKSYWLTIHVATITTSYAVLGFAAFLSLLNIFFAAYLNGKGKFNDTINEFTSLNQSLIILGLYLLTIGSFLGGIWANESWGTYWSWDPKETWSLVSILIYSFVAHMKHIPSLRSRITYNIASLLSYSSIMMTYFGVNYFLGGMHSYGKGSAFELSYPMLIAGVFMIFTLFYASYKERGNM